MFTLLIVVYVLVLLFALLADRRARLDRLAWTNYSSNAPYWMYFYWQAREVGE